MELINILIRTSNRPDKFKRCLQSVTSQAYPNIRIIVSCDNVCDYVPAQLERVQVTQNRDMPYFYDEYCNTLKSMVTEGWFMFLDDDDYLIPDVLGAVVLDHPAIIHRLSRNGNIAPIGLDFKRGHIGMPCLMLHHSLKSLADIPGTGQGDYVWIKSIHQQFGCVLRDLVIVGSDGRGLGR